MADPLKPITINAPGFKGLNTNSVSTSLSPDWARTCENAVFDDSGRIASRKGWTKLTTSAISGTPDIEAIVEYKEDKDTRSLIFAANAKLYETSTVTTNYDTNTEIQGSLTPTNDKWKFVNFNGKIIGVQDGEEPIVFTGTGNFTTIQSNITSWANTTAYSLNDVVKATSGNTTIYFLCTVAGTSAGSEPTWNTSEGDTTTDNTVTWTTVFIPQGNEIHAAYGRLWAIDSDRTTVRYSGLLNEEIWDTANGGGVIDLTLVKGFLAGVDFATAINSFGNQLIVFGNENILIWKNPDIPTVIEISDSIIGIGNVARDAVQNIGDDILFLDDTGVRSLRRALVTSTLPTSDISFNVRNEITSEVKGIANLDSIKSCYHHLDGFYVLVVPPFAYYFDIRNPIPPDPGVPGADTFRVTKWTGIDIKSAVWSDTDSTMYIGKEGVVGEYSTYLDNATTYIMRYLSVDTDLGNQQRKFPKRITATVTGGSGYVVNFNWRFDFGTSEVTVTSPAITSAAVGAEWGVAEWNLGEWSGGTSVISQVDVPMSRSGQYFRYGWTVEVNGKEIGFETIDIRMVLGRIN